ncbi:MAG: histidine triad nucleotide-binding protein [Burkholderiaceae bacterium]
MNPDCLFCKIAAGSIPARKAYEDDEFLAFHDINPAAPVHVLVIPKIHIESLADCEGRHAELLGRMVGLAPRIAREQGVGYDGPDGASGFKTIFNTGRGGGQEVYHLHLHILGGARPWKPR